MKLRLEMPSSGRFGRELLVFAGVMLLAAASFGQMPRSSVQKEYPFVDPFKRLDKVEYSKDHFIVVFNPTMSDGLKDSVVRQMGLKIDASKESPYFSVVELPARVRAGGITVESAVRYFNQMPGVRYAEFDVALTPDFIPNDPSFGNLYGLHNTGQSGGTPDADMDVTEAWDITGVGNEVVVAVCDDGVDWTHPDLAANIWSNVDEIPGNGIDDDANGYIDDIRGWDFNGNDNNPIGGSGDSHGTHVAGTVGAVNNNGIGLSGAGRNTKIMPLRMYGASAPNWMSDLTNAVDYAWRNGAKVISVSYNIDGYTNALVEAIQRADAADVVYCNSAGNNGALNPPRAAIRDLANNVIFVAASDRNDNRASFSNYGAKIEIFAAGVDVYSTLPGNSYGNNSGTSMATPNVASVISVLRAYFPALSDREVLDRLIGAADQVPQLASFIPDGRRANLNSALETDTAPPAAVADLTVSRRAFTVVEMSFRTSGDDGMTGAAEGYDVRVSSLPITDANFSSAQPMSVSVPSLPAGQLVTAQPQGFWPGQTVYVAVQAKDNLGNRSAVSSFGPVNLKSTYWGDRVEGVNQFTATGTWATTTTKAFSGTRSWTDTPTGNYPNNANLILTQTNAVTVPGPVGVSFWGDLALEANDDFLYLEYQINGGAWQQANRWTGTSTWKNLAGSIPSNPGDSVRIRFRLVSDGSTTANGVYIDDICFVSTVQAYFDNLEGGTHYAGQSPWAVTTTDSFSPTRSWTDSPGGNYANNLNISMTGNMDIGVGSLAGPRVFFKSKFNLENNYDYLHVEGSTDSGSTWTSGGSLNGVQSVWGGNGFDLPSGNAVRLRFRLSTDTSVVRDGVFLDDIEVKGEPWENLKIFTANLSFPGFQGFIQNEAARVEVLMPGTSTLVESMDVPLKVVLTRNFGVADFSTPTTGVYDLRFHIPGYLKRRATSVDLSSIQSNVKLGMIGGDANGDNVINNADVVLIQSLLGVTSGQPSYVRSVDITGNGIIDNNDLQMAINNQGMTGG